MQHMLASPTRGVPMQHKVQMRNKLSAAAHFTGCMHTNAAARLEVLPLSA
jgi:hypothetical protein